MLINNDNNNTQNHKVPRAEQRMRCSC